MGILKQITETPELSDFNLVGSTSLALQIGHRMSYDLYFFGNRHYETKEILDLLKPVGQVRIMSQSKNILILNVEGVKVDFVNYRYPLLNPVLHTGGLRLLGLPDIAAMKLAAIACPSSTSNLYAKPNPQTPNHSTSVRAAGVSNF